MEAVDDRLSAVSKKLKAVSGFPTALFRDAASVEPPVTLHWR